MSQIDKDTERLVNCLKTIKKPDFVKGYEWQFLTQEGNESSIILANGLPQQNKGLNTLLVTAIIRTDIEHTDRIFVEAGLFAAKVTNKLRELNGLHHAPHSVYMFDLSDESASALFDPEAGSGFIE